MTCETKTMWKASPSMIVVFTFRPQIHSLFHFINKPLLSAFFFFRFFLLYFFQQTLFLLLPALVANVLFSFSLCRYRWCEELYAIQIHAKYSHTPHTKENNAIAIVFFWLIFTTAAMCFFRFFFCLLYSFFPYFICLSPSLPIVSLIVYV